MENDDPTSSIWRCSKCGNRIELLIRPSAAPVCCSTEMTMIEGPDRPISTRITPGQRVRGATLTDRSGRSGPDPSIDSPRTTLKWVTVRTDALTPDAFDDFERAGAFDDFELAEDDDSGGFADQTWQVRRALELAEPWSERTKRRWRQRIGDRVAAEQRRRPAVDINTIVADVRGEFTDEGRFTLRTCPHCGDKFEAQRSTAQFCNATCRKAHHRKESK
jgi:hypothetical protein